MKKDSFPLGPSTEKVAKKLLKKMTFQTLRNELLHHTLLPMKFGKSPQLTFSVVPSESVGKRSSQIQFGDCQYNFKHSSD